MTAVDDRIEALCGDLSAISAPRGSRLNALSWQTEAPLRMLLNNLDPEVAEHPEDLVVYGGSGRAARSHEALRDIVGTLLRLRDDETLLVQSGKPVGVFRTQAGAPRVLIANSLLVPKWATWDEFRRLEAEGLTMFGQMTAGSWIYIGTQGILQGTYQTFCAAGEVHFGSADLSGRTVLTAGLGGMGGAQPLAATMAGAAILCVEVDQRSIDRRLAMRYLDEQASSLDDAVARVRSAAAAGDTAVGCPPRKRRRCLPGARRTRGAVRPRHGPDRCPRSADGLRARRGAVRGGCGAARTRSEALPGARVPVDRDARPRHVRLRPDGVLCFRLWQQSTRGGSCRRPERGVLIPGLRPGLYQAALLSRHRAVQMGCSLR